jgi:DNA-binding transcriptional regulator YiaG
MSKYFIDTEIYYQNKKQPPKKVIITTMYNEPNGHTALCYDEDGDEYSIELSDIYDDNDNPIKDARNKLGLSQEKFAKLFEIPKRTLEDWETKKSNPPKYTLNLIIEKVFSMLERND